MLNSTIFGGYEARRALQDAYLKLELNDDWCIGGGCKHYSESAAGRKRFNDLKKKFGQHRLQNLETRKEL